MARSKKSDRMVFTLTARVEKTDFNSDSETYRISGIVERDLRILSQWAHTTRSTLRREPH